MTLLGQRHSSRRTGRSFTPVRLFVTPWTAARQAFLSIINSWSLLKLMSLKLVMPSNHLILCRPLLLPSVFPRSRVFSNESVLRIRWPKYWSFIFSISPCHEYSGLISFGICSRSLLWKDTFIFWSTLPPAGLTSHYIKHLLFPVGSVVSINILFWDS